MRPLGWCTGCVLPTSPSRLVLRAPALGHTYRTPPPPSAKCPGCQRPAPNIRYILLPDARAPCASMPPASCLYQQGTRQGEASPAACCLLPAACCLLPAACCLLPAACCLLPAACPPASLSSCLPAFLSSSQCMQEQCSGHLQEDKEETGDKKGDETKERRDKV